MGITMNKRIEKGVFWCIIFFMALLWQGCGGISPEDLEKQNPKPPVKREDPPAKPAPNLNAPTKIYNREKKESVCEKDHRACRGDRAINPEKDEPKAQPRSGPSP